jgi:hypothetical protein
MGEHGKWGKRKRRGRGFDSMPYPQRRCTETIEFRERKQQGWVCSERFLFLLVAAPGRQGAGQGQCAGQGRGAQVTRTGTGACRRGRGGARRVWAHKMQKDDILVVAVLQRRRRMQEEGAALAVAG